MTGQQEDDIPIATMTMKWSAQGSSGRLFDGEARSPWGPTLGFGTLRGNRVSTLGFGTLRGRAGGRSLPFRVTK